MTWDTILHLSVSVNSTTSRNSMKTLIIHHNADNDGWFSGWILRYWLEKRGEECTTVGWNYGDPCPSIEGYDKIFMADISIPELLEDKTLWNKIVWIDHHKSAIDKYDNERIAGIRIDGVAACRLCWQYMTNEGCVLSYNDFYTRSLYEPYVVQMVGEYDVWDKRDPNADRYQVALALQDWDYITAKDYFEAYRPNVPDSTCLEIEETLADQGAMCLSYQNQQNKRLVERSYTIQFEGLKFLVLNTSQGNSQVFESKEREDHHACMMWRYDGREIKVSLYHKVGREDLDLSTIAVKYGGGGHRGACGFSLSINQLLASTIITKIS